MKIFMLIPILFAMGINTWSQDPNSTLDSTISYSFSSLSDSTLSNKTAFAYDADGNLAIRETYTWDSIQNKWFGNNKSETSFDADRHPTLNLSYNWDANLNDWVKTTKSEYFQDADGNTTLIESYNWDSNLNDWVISVQNEYGNDADGNLTLQAQYDWDSNLNNWVISYKSESSYDADGNNTFQASYVWDLNLNDWLAVNKSEISFDADGTLTSSRYFRWYSNTNGYVLSGITFYYYNDASTPTDDLIYNNEIKIYPNPVSEVLYISSPQEFHTEIFDMMGRKMLYTNQNDIILTPMQDGAYILRITDADGNILKIERIIKE